MSYDELGYINLGLYCKGFDKRERMKVRERERSGETSVELDRQPQPKISHSIKTKYGASSTHMAEFCWTTDSL